MKKGRRVPNKSQTLIALTPSRLAAFFVATVVMTVLITMQFTTSSPELGPLPNITPHDASSMKTLEVFEDDHDALLWGTYRPHTYFGLRTASPNSLLAGAWLHAAYHDPAPFALLFDSLRIAAIATSYHMRELTLLLLQGSSGGMGLDPFATGWSQVGPALQRSS